MLRLHYWLVDLLESEGARVHLAHPSGLAWEGRRVKNDEIDATSPGLLRRESFSPSPTMVFATARSVAWPRRGERLGHGQDASSEIGMTPREGVVDVM